MTGRSTGERGPKPLAIDGFQQSSQAAAERLLGARTGLDPQARQPLRRRRSRGRNPANCSHFCSHLADFGPTDPVRAGVYERTTASLLSSRSCVRITQGALVETAVTLGSEPVGAREAERRFSKPSPWLRGNRFIAAAPVGFWIIQPGSSHWWASGSCQGPADAWGGRAASTCCASSASSG